MNRVNSLLKVFRTCSASVACLLLSLGCYSVSATQNIKVTDYQQFRIAVDYKRKSVASDLRYDWIVLEYGSSNVPETIREIVSVRSLGVDKLDEVHAQLENLYKSQIDLVLTNPILYTLANNTGRNRYVLLDRVVRGQTQVDDDKIKEELFKFYFPADEYGAIKNYVDEFFNKITGDERKLCDEIRASISELSNFSDTDLYNGYNSLDKSIRAQYDRKKSCTNYLSVLLKYTNIKKNKHILCDRLSGITHEKLYDKIKQSTAEQCFDKLDNNTRQKIFKTHPSDFRVHASVISKIHDGANKSDLETFYKKHFMSGYCPSHSIKIAVLDGESGNIVKSIKMPDYFNTEDFPELVVNKEKPQYLNGAGEVSFSVLPYNERTAFYYIFRNSIDDTSRYYCCSFEDKQCKEQPVLISYNPLYDLYMAIFNRYKDNDSVTIASISDICSALHIPLITRFCFDNNRALVKSCRIMGESLGRDEFRELMKHLGIIEAFKSCCDKKKYDAVLGVLERIVGTEFEQDAGKSECVNWNILNAFSKTLELIDNREIRQFFNELKNKCQDPENTSDNWNYKDTIALDKRLVQEEIERKKRNPNSKFSAELEQRVYGIFRELNSLLNKSAFSWYKDDIDKIRNFISGQNKYLQVPLSAIAATRLVDKLVDEFSVKKGCSELELMFMGESLYSVEYKTFSFRDGKNKSTNIDAIQIATGSMGLNRCRLMSLAYLELDCQLLPGFKKEEDAKYIDYIVACINNKLEYDDMDSIYFTEDVKQMICHVNGINHLSLGPDLLLDSFGTDYTRLSHTDGNHFNLCALANDYNNKYVWAHILLHYFVNEKGTFSDLTKQVIK